METLQEAFTSFLKSIGGFMPGILGAIIVLIIGWLIAKGIKKLVYKVLQKTELDNKILKNTSGKVSSEVFISKLVYYLIMIIVLMIVLEMMGVSQVLDPLKNMTNKFFGFIPNLLAAGIIGYVGYIIANIVSELVGMGGSALTNLSNKLRKDESSKSIDLAKILKKVVFILIFIPILIAAIDALNIKAISEPATQMLSTFINSIPNILAAIIIIGAFYIGGRFIMSLLKDLLESAGLDTLSEKLNLSGMLGNQGLSGIVSKAAFFFIVFFGVITGIEKLEFVQLNEVLTNILGLSGRIFFGLIIMVAGNFLANLAQKSLSKGNQGNFMGNIAKIAILGLFLSISLDQMGIADNIVNLAFGLTLGAVAVAVALAFGLGGREAAGKQMDHILKKFRKDN